MPVYMLFSEKVHDDEAMREYSKAAAAAFGPDSPPVKVLGVDRSPTVLEGAWPATQTVLLEFEDEAAAQAWYGSPGYQAAIALRQNAADTDVVILHGF